MEQESKWFTINTITNYENTVADAIMKKKETMHLDDIVDVCVPTVKHMTPTGKIKDKNKYPGYFFIKLKIYENDQPSPNIWWILRNIRGSLGILNREKYMISLTDEELTEFLKSL